MIRALGAVMVAVGALWAGWRASAELRDSVRAVEAVIDGLELLERELWERGTALPELLGGLSGRTRDPVSTLFAQCAQACQELDRFPFGDSWRRLTADLAELSPEGRAALLPLGEVLGRYEADGQRAALKRAEEALERERERAEKEQERMGRVYQTLSLAGGAFLVILLL